MDHTRRVPDAFAILPSGAYLFDQARRVDDYRIVARSYLADGIEVLAINQGLLAFDFKQSALAGHRFITSQGHGEYGDETDSFIALQALRLRLAIFTAACVYGVHAKRTHSALDRPLYPTLSEIYNWTETSGSVVAIPKMERDRLLEYFIQREATRAGPHVSIRSISIDSFNEGLALANRLKAAAPDYKVSDPVALIAMTYQALVLHGRQHAGASIALAAVIVEAVVEELLFAAGLVKGVDKRLKLSGRNSQTPSSMLSSSRLKDLGFKGMVTALEGVGLVNGYLAQRIAALRKARNALMHDAQDAAPRQSGEALTVLRDVLWLCTGETEFELNTGWSCRC